MLGFHKSHSGHATPYTETAFDCLLTSVLPLSTSAFLDRNRRSEFTFSTSTCSGVDDEVRLTVYVAAKLTVY